MIGDKGDRVIFILGSIHQVLRAEKILEKAGLDFDLTPVPKEVNPDCGMAIETAPAEAEATVRAILAAGLNIEAAYRRSPGGFEPVDRALYKNSSGEEGPKERN
jgi:hypothetical protein